MSDTFGGSKRAVQPQFQGAAPRAADPGMGAGPRPYAPGATSAYQAPTNPLARDSVTPPGVYPPPGTQPSPGPGFSGKSSHPSQQPGNPMMQMQLAQTFANRLVEMLYQRNEQRRSG